jgi:mono/diheme cytochrome c family protein
MNRLIIQSIEGRILAGISMFVAIMILIGWVAINEEARMQSFVRQYTGRSIERGAELFSANCTTCHGAEGLGIGGRAPGLNNPHYFGFDPIAEQTSALIGANRVLDGLTEESEALTAEFTDSENPPSVERQDEILAELEAIDAQIDEQEAIIEEATTEREAALASLAPAVERGLFPQWQDVSEDQLTSFLNTNGNRLSQVGWTGDLHGYTVTTLIHGRPGSGNVWPNSEGMAAWSQTAGGPLRDDQIEDITAYILNWDKGSEWTLDDFFAVEQYGKPLADGSVPQGPPKVVAGTDVDAILSTIEADAIVGDAANGESLYEGVTYGCSGCHLNGAAAPNTVGTWSRVQDERLTLPQFADYTEAQYLIESIVRPDDYVVDGYNSGAMPVNFGERLSAQELADIVAYLESQG